ncbi:hypothetical protein J3R30DRAFT_948374 [Lentinula aciculospora]|uniref:Uncharacterized protein n=1 Tax=Lentinula aciculospora TaxID=153920 RepID=A0A9W9AQU8_9AGAR|nr:hypothetical protein J3R30DRAFT_948374 [Lentinula aciculospora]
MYIYVYSSLEHPQQQSPIFNAGSLISVDQSPFPLGKVQLIVSCWSNFLFSLVCSHYVDQQPVFHLGCRKLVVYPFPSLIVSLRHTTISRYYIVAGPFHFSLSSPIHSIHVVSNLALILLTRSTAFVLASISRCDFHCTHRCSQSTAAGVKPWALRIGLFNGQWLNRTDVAKGVSGFLFLCAGPFQCAGYANGKVTLVNPEVTQPELEKEFFIKLKPSILIKYSSYQTLTAKLLRKETYAYLKLFFNLVNVAKLQTEVHDLKEETDEDYILLVLEYTKEKFMVNNEYDEGNAKEVMRQWRPRQNDPRI